MIRNMVPEEFREIDQWICGKGKKPRAPWATGHEGPASWQEQENLTSFEEAKEWADHMPGWWVGFVVDDTPYAYIDLDDCRDPETGEISDFAAKVVRSVDSFTEVSGSGTGLHIYVKAELDGDMGNQSDPDDGDKIEMYDNRIAYVTGDVVDQIGGVELSTDIEDAQAEMETLQERFMEEQEPVTDRDYDPPEGLEGRHRMYRLGVADVYPDLPIGKNVEHPEHGSSTGSNFKITQDGDVAVCWHGGHATGRGDGCGLNAQHMLAIARTGRACDTVRTRWPEDDSLVYAAWTEAVQRLGLDPEPVPFRAKRHIAEEEAVVGFPDERSAHQRIEKILRDRGFGV